MKAMHSKLALLGVSIGLTACAEAKYLLQKYNPLDNVLNSYESVPGEGVGGNLASLIRSPKDEVAAVLDALSVAEKEEGNANLLAAGLITLEEATAVPEVTDDVLKVLTATQQAKLAYNADSFVEDDESILTPDPPAAFLADHDFTKDTVTWPAGKDRFVISTLSKMPVRDQGRRGTCSSFAGIAQVEGYILKNYSGVDAIDLSEQRFYYMSKPENWTSGGDAAKGGSNAGTGFAKSAGIEYDGKDFPPDSPHDYNLPLEGSCPYNPLLGSNDLQTPQADGCKTGVAKVTDLAAWLHQWEERPLTAQDIFDMVLNEDIPVVVMTKLSSNWENNDGMITLAGAGGAGGVTSHAGGHAYLIIGAKKIDDASFPGEGGMCFIIRNSWGPGWGVKGHSCMTLAWFNHWRFPSAFPRIKDVDLDEDAFGEAVTRLNDRPSNIIDADDSTRGSGKQSRLTPKRGRATLLTGETLLVDDEKVGGLYGDNDAYYKVLYRVNGDELILRGILTDNEHATHELKLGLQDTTVKFTAPDGRVVDVGSLDAAQNTITLCSKTYSQVCHLRYVKEWNELVVGLTEIEFYREDSAGPYNWRSLGLAGYSVDVSSPPGLNSKLDVRLQSGGKTTNPLRFLLEPTSGDIRFGGKAIGSLTKASFCSGDYAGVCRLVVAADKFQVLFKGSK